MHNRFVQRRERLRPIIERENLDLFLVTSEKNVSYLTGFSGDSTWLVAGTDSERLVSDGRYTGQLQEECPDIEARIRPPSVKLHEGTISLLKESQPRRIGIEGHVVSIELRDQLAAGLEGVELVPLGS
ncbi:MAG: aminopeptidase P family N-terminal domain-containing protein, partial [Planctomycetaceae bacterium]|nr:aminopeptidase P family N-terminal domain-containing protein [Planctomycetaceae bacterium]